MKVSVVVPIYNVEKYIRRCMESIQQQTMNDIEIIVVNDCTPDDSMAIVEDLAKEDQRIRIFNYDKNRGPMCARETGYMAATGDYITFCDSDDYLPSTAIEKLYVAAVESDADIVSGNIIYFTTKGEEHPWKNKLKYGNTRTDVLKSLLRHELSHNLPGKLFKASLLHDYEYRTYENFTNGEDASLFYQIVSHMDQMALINDVVYHYMQNVESSTQVRISKYALENLIMANAEIARVAIEFPILGKDVDARISENIVNMIYKGYDKESALSQFISKYQLDKYKSNRVIIHSHSFKEATALLLKKYVRTSVKRFLN